MTTEKEETIEKKRENEQKQYEKDRKAREKQQEKERKQANKEREKKEKEKEKKMKRKMKKAPYKLPFWLRIVTILIGVSFILASSAIYAFPDLTIRTSIYILTAILAFSGISRIINAFYEKEISGTSRIVRFAFGGLLILFSIVIFFSQALAEESLLVFLGVALIIQGLGRGIVGFTHEVMPSWLKLVLIILGAASILVGTGALVPSLLSINNNQGIIYLLVVGFYLSGLSRIFIGLGGVGKEKRSS